MRTLYLIFERFGAILLFVLLQIICFYLVVNYNKNQGMIWLSSTSYFTGAFHNLSNRAMDFVYLDQITDSLAAENAALRDQLDLLQSRYTDTRDTVRQDSFRQKYAYLAAEVVKNSINLPNNMITINKGSKDGVKEHMGVITDKGVVGIVRKVGKKYALVMSILNRESNVNARIKSNGYFGPLVWREDENGRNHRILFLEDIPKHVIVHPNDTIQTTGYSTIFPTGINIGVIDSVVLSSSEISHKIWVRLFEDLANIQYVYVLEYLEKNDIEELEKVLENE